MSRKVSAFVFAVLTVMVATGAYAQFTPKRIWTLTIVVNVPGAVIVVDNQQLPGNQARVTGGPHNVQVMADGYLPFSGSLVVNGDQTFPVNLQPAAPRNGQVAPMAPAQPPVNGQVAPMPPAQPPVNGQIAPRSPARVVGFLLTINVNVQGAAVFVDGVPVQGMPIVGPGPHSVQVTAPGYQDYTASVNVTQPLTLNVALNPVVRPSTLTFVIPRGYHDPDMHPDDPRSFVRIIVDGTLVNPQGEMERIPVQPGRHRIRIASGAFSVELGDMDFRPRTDYVLELGMDVKVRVSKPGVR